MICADPVLHPVGWYYFAEALQYAPAIDLHSVVVVFLPPNFGQVSRLPDRQIYEEPKTMNLLPP